MQTHSKTPNMHKTLNNKWLWRLTIPVLAVISVAAACRQKQNIYNQRQKLLQILTLYFSFAYQAISHLTHTIKVICIYVYNIFL